MGRLIWDAVGEKFYEMGTKCGVLYPMTTEGTLREGCCLEWPYRCDREPLWCGGDQAVC